MVGIFMKALQSQIVLLAMILAALLPCFAQKDKADTGQKRTVRVGVAMMINRSQRIVNTAWERDQLAHELQRMGKSRKSQVVIEPVALDASSREEAGAEAAKKDCQYFVLTTLLDGSYGPSVVVGPEGAQRGPTMAGNANPQQTVMMDFKLYEVGAFGTVVDGMTTAPEEDANDTRAADEAMRMVAVRVTDKLKK